MFWGLYWGSPSLSKQSFTVPAWSIPDIKGQSIYIYNRDAYMDQNFDIVPFGVRA